MASGAAAGLCAVLGTVTLVITMGAGHEPASHATFQASGRSEQGAGGRSAEYAVGRTVSAWAGKGGRGGRLVPLDVPAATWGLAWSFRCPPGQSGTFVLRRPGRASPGTVTQSVRRQRDAGIWWFVRDPGVHAVVVQSSCPWRARVVLPRPGSAGGSPTASPRPEHSPQPQHTHGPEPKHTHNPEPQHSHGPEPKHTHSQEPKHTHSRKSPNSG